MAFNTNQFKQIRVVGALDLSTNPNPAIFTVRYNAAGVGGDVIPGEGLKLIDLGATDSEGPPIVDVRTANADSIFGVVIHNTRKNTQSVGDVIDVAGEGAVIVMEASAAILRGAKVSPVLATPGQVVTTTTEALFGVALDKAPAIGDLLRVKIIANGTV